MKLVLSIVVVLHAIARSSQSASIFHLANIPVNWFEANLICRQYGYKLAVVDSAHKQAQIEHEIRSFRITNRAFWLSGTNLADPQRWSWMSDGQPLNYTNWAPAGDVADPNSRCLRIQPHRVQQWQAFPCHLEMHFVCEEETTTK